ncbi:MAG: fungal-specific transcription factor domain-containing protein [Benjaminiella poitrasii]|nr:MAG: fungal-specific transcription factor domain-containing protein [Benjaminiella poitrasii]
MGKATQELKYKRLKVGHACYVCRSKKIKCDGLIPCMQCKARGRVCQSSNPELQNDTVTENNITSDNQDEVESSQSNIESDDDSILFARTKQSSNIYTKLTPTYSCTWTSNAVQRAAQENKKSSNRFLFGETHSFGSFVCWHDEPPLPHKYSSPVEMPSNEVQMHMIDLFFQTRYKITPFIPKRLFYEQLRIKGPLITPLLLNAIYCVVSSFTTIKDVPKAAVFFNRAKKLIDDFLDVPRVSTVAALCLLSLYEPIPTKSKSTIDQHCRSWIYSGIAFRMCLELGLNMDTPRSRNRLSEESIELRRRVFWACYCLDKLQSIEWERLWSIPSSLAKCQLPRGTLDDDEEEQWVLLAFQQTIKLCQLAEEGLQIRASFSFRDDIGYEKFLEETDQYVQKILHWQDSLPSQDIWNFKQREAVDDMINTPRIPPTLCYVSMIYYFLLTDALSCLPDTEQNAKKCRTYAAQLTICAETICDNPSMVLRYEFITHATIAAIRVHSRYLDDKDPETARQSSILFNQCTRILQKIQKHAIIPQGAVVLRKISDLWQRSQNTQQPSSSPASMDAAAESIKLLSVNTSMNPPIADSPVVPSSANVTTFNNVLYRNQQLEANENMHQPSPSGQSELSPGHVVDPYRTDIPINNFNYQNSDGILVSTPYNNLVAFGSTVNIDFTDRKQLWEYALQGANQQNYDNKGSLPASPKDAISHSIATSNGRSSDWMSPNGTEFNWPNPIASQQRQQQQSSHTPPLSSQQQPQQRQILSHQYSMTSPQQPPGLNSVIAHSYLSNYGGPHPTPLPPNPIRSNNQSMNQQQQPNVSTDLSFGTNPADSIPQHAYFFLTNFKL